MSAGGTVLHRQLYSQFPEYIITMPVIEVSNETLRQLDYLRIRMQVSGYDEVIRHLMGVEYIRPAYIKDPDPKQKRPDDRIGIYKVE
ncbi:MAG: hypothetical protein C5S48_03815 [Candidatus Methanogaster sp.]|nr:MAG: hypothetical protein C5S48_03815 [ANME-2 cluster archaeon]